MPVPTPSYPLHKVEMSFVDNPLGTDPYDYSGASAVGGWVDVTADVRSVSVDRGRNNDLEKVDAGTATIVLDNRTRKYDPLNQSSIYWDSTAGATLLKPRRQVKISGVYPNDCTVNNYCYDLVSGNTWSPYVANNFTTRGLNIATSASNTFSYTGGTSDYFSLSYHVQPINGFTWSTANCWLGSEASVGALEINAGVIYAYVDDGSLAVETSENLFALNWIEDDTKPLWLKLEFVGVGTGTTTLNLYVAPTAFEEPDNDWQLLKTKSPATSPTGNTTSGSFGYCQSFAVKNINLKRVVSKRENPSNVVIKQFDLLADTHINIFQGYTQGFPQNFSQFGEDATVNLECFDLMGLLGNMTTSLDYVQQVLDMSDVWGWWRLGDNETTAVDSSGNNHDLVYRNKLNQSGNTEPIARGLNGVGTSFANVGNNRPRVNSGNVVPVTTLNDCTLMGWFVSTRILTTASADLPIVQFWDSSGTYQDINLSVTMIYAGDQNGTALNQVRAYYRSNILHAVSPFVTNPINVSDGKAHHFALVVNNFTDVTLYVDGRKEAITVGGTVNNIYTGGNISIGSIDYDGVVVFAGGSGGTFQGTISDIIYLDNTILSASEVEEVYKAGLGYDAELSAERMQRICTFAGVPSRLQAFDYNTVGTCGALRYNDEDAVLALMQLVEDTEQGIFYADREGRLTLLGRYYLSTQDAGIRVNALFSDDASDSERIKFRNLRFSFDGDQLANNHVVQDDTNARYEYEDATSITEYGRRTRTIQTLLSDTEAARQMAIGLTNIYKNPLIKAEEFEIVPLQNNWFDVLPLDIGFRTELRVTPMGTGAEIDQDLALQRIRYEISPKEWNVFVSASPRPVVSFFVLDKSVLDGADVLGY